MTQEIKNKTKFEVIIGIGLGSLIGNYILRNQPMPVWAQFAFLVLILAYFGWRGVNIIEMWIEHRVAESPDEGILPDENELIDFARKLGTALGRELAGRGEV